MLIHSICTSGSGANLSVTIPLTLPGQPGNLITGKTYRIHREGWCWLTNPQLIPNGKVLQVRVEPRIKVSTLKL